MFQDKFITDLRLILFFGRFRVIGLSSLIVVSFQIDDFHKRNQFWNDFDSVLKKFQAFFRTEVFRNIPELQLSQHKLASNFLLKTKFC